MKTFLVLAAITFSVLALDTVEIQEKWMKFKTDFNKSYRSALEERKRFAIFQDTLRDIEEHNALYAAGKVSYNKGVNQFSDMTDEEFLEFLGPFKSYDEVNVEDMELYDDNDVVPERKDWRNHTNPVRDQMKEKCHSGWSFASIGAIETRRSIKGMAAPPLSAQYLIDCNKKGTLRGCQDGHRRVNETFHYIRTHGIPSEEKYPYTATDNGICHSVPADNLFNITSYGYIRNNETRLLHEVYFKGPVTVAVHATHEMKSYTTGLFIDKTCNDTESNFNHVLLIVGYGTVGVGIGVNKPFDYWILKNSWGTRWGEQGYIRMKRRINQCGLANFAIFPIV